MRLFLVFIFWLIRCFVVAQTPYEIRGVVKDQADSLVFANGLLLNKSDSTLIKGTFIENGVIHIRDVVQDTALLKIESLDVLDTLYTIVRPEAGVLDLGVIYVKTGVLLDAVNVSAMKPAFISGSSGETIINVKGSMLENSTSVREVLSKSPSVLVEDGNVSVFGKGEAIILLKGKLISFAQLQAIPVSNIERIEVLTNPPAKYDASGKAVINIILTENPMEGFLGEIVQNTTYAQFLQSYTTVALNYRKKKLSLQGSYGQDLGRNWGTNQLKRETYSDIGNTISVNDFEDQSNLKYFNTYNLGLTYSINPKNSLSLEYAGSSSITDQDSEAQTTFDGLSDNDIEINTVNSGENKYFLQSFNLNYTSIIDSLGSNLFIGGHYFLFDNNSDNLIDEEIMSNESSNRFNRKNESSTGISFGTAQIDFQKFIKSSSTLFEIGIKGVSADNTGVVDFYSKSAGDGQYSYFPSLSNDFTYRERIGAMYTQFSSDLGEKTNLSIGVRGELTDANGVSSALNTTIIDTSYFNVFPSMKLQYKFNGKWNANLSFSSSINRPTYQALDPFLFYVDSLTTNQGNPNLNPEYAYSIESNIRFKRYSLKIGYTLTEDAFRYALLPGVNGQSSSTLMQINVEREHSYFASIQLPIAIKNFIQSYNVVGVTQDRVDDSRPEFSSSAYIPRVYLFSNNIIDLKKVGKLQLGFRLMGTRYDGIYYRKPFYNVAIGWSKSFMNDRLNINFLADDIFHSNVVDGYYELASARVSYLRRMNTKLYRLTIRYNFGKLKEPGFSSVNIGEDSNRRIRK